jgi:RNA polymerase sigma-70 factor (ECF subfamily)
LDDREEHHWICRARAGDRDAFALLVQRYWGRVYRWLHGMTLRRQSAEDLTRAVFLRAWSALPQLRQGVRFHAWLFRIARLCLTDGRRGPPSAAESAPDREAGEPLRAACAELAEPLRAALLLWTGEEFSFAEVAQILDVTEETARWHVCRARRVLLRRLRAHRNGEAR